MVTSNDIRDLVLAEIKDTDDGLVGGLWPTIWLSYADKATIWPRLQELYSKRRAIDILLAYYRMDTTFTISAALHGTTELQIQQRTSNLRALRKEVDTEITTEENKARAIRPGVVIPMTVTEIESPADAEALLTQIPDANSPLYRGDPYLSPGEGTGTAGPV